MPAGVDRASSFQVTATDADSQTGQTFIGFTVNEIGSLIIDNPDATFVDTWPAITE